MAGARKMKGRFNTELEANEYREKHELFGQVVEPISGGKFGLVYPIEIHVTVEGQQRDAGGATAGRAPISVDDRAQLFRDAADPKRTAKRKGVTLDSHEEVKEKMVATTHFELGCWLHRFTKLHGLPPEKYLSERIDLVSRIFLAGFTNPRYDFFTVFDFGERQFDSIFEQSDAEAVLEGLRRNIELDSTGKIASAFKYFGWPLTADAVQIESADSLSEGDAYPSPGN